jgi:anthrone oxygenase-like protein
VATALLGWVAALAPGLFAVAALYVSLVEHPARLSLGSRAAVHEFGPSYRRGAALQAPLALIGALAAIGRWALGGSVWWLAGGIALGALVPYTLVIVLPTSTRLLDPALDRDSRGSVLLTSAVCSPR